MKLQRLEISSGGGDGGCICLRAAATDDGGIRRKRIGAAINGRADREGWTDERTD